MCNDYERHIRDDTYATRMHTLELRTPVNRSPVQLGSADEVRINDMAPVMRTSGNVVELASMRWRFPASRPGGKPVFNFRSGKRRFDEGHRCLIPASAFFEFTGVKSPKSKWRSALEEAPFLAIAGIGRPAASGEPPMFTMLTVGPGADVGPFHDRQVAVLRARDWESWLYLDCTEGALLRLLPARSLEVEVVLLGVEEPDATLRSQASAAA